MNTTETHAIEHAPARETSSASKWVAGGSMMEAVGAIATIALAIVGLAGVFSATMAAIATIVIGAAFLLESGSFSAAQLSSRSGEFEGASGGTSAAFLGGVAGIVLGILALLGIASITLLSVAAIVYGATFLLSGVGQSGNLAAAAGGHTLVGLGAAVLGILAVVGLSPLVLVLVALLSLGAGALFSGSAQGAQAMSQTSSRTVEVHPRTE
jgi:hypothetical protein